MIFVSSRDESAHSAGRLGHLLGDRFGSEEVFLADSVLVGRDPAAATDAALRQCAAAVVVVDPTWAAAEDPVIRQVSALLERGIAVLPVLVDGAQPPRADDLPDSVRGLARLQAVRLDHLTFRSDAEQVAEWIETAIRGEPPPPPRRPRGVRRASPGRPVPLVRSLWRMALWWTVFPFAIITSMSVFRLALGREQPGVLGVSIALTAILILLLGVCVLTLRREIAAQRLMIDRAGPEARFSGGPGHLPRPGVAAHRRLRRRRRAHRVEHGQPAVAPATAPASSRQVPGGDHGIGRLPGATIVDMRRTVLVTAPEPELLEREADLTRVEAALDCAQGGAGGPWFRPFVSEASAFRWARSAAGRGPSSPSLHRRRVTRRA